MKKEGVAGLPENEQKKRNLKELLLQNKDNDEHILVHFWDPERVESFDKFTDCKGVEHKLGFFTRYEKILKG